MKNKNGVELLVDSLLKENVTDIKRVGIGSLNRGNVKNIIGAYLP